MAAIRVRGSLALVTVIVAACLLAACNRDPDRDTPAPSPPAALPGAQPDPADARQHFRPPTANLALFEADAGDRYFVGTVGRTWTSGTFGCVRSEGYQLHEGLDIRALDRDARGEALDPVLATADGVVAYVNPKAALSNYGIYVVLRHEIQGWELFTLYAHLARVDPRLRLGLEVKCGETLGIMGRTANTRSGISRERAHLHLEINLLINDRFADWHLKHFPDQRNDHGIWNGRNLLGIDPLPLLLEQHRNPASLDLAALIRQQRVLCRTLVRSTDFDWLHRYPATVESRPHNNPDKIVAHEIHHNFVGIPIRIIPRTADEATGRARFQLLEVNAVVAREFPCQKLVRQRDGKWQLTANGERFLDLLTF